MPGRVARSIRAGQLAGALIKFVRDDVAFLFDPDGFEIDRYAYSHHRGLSTSGQRRKRLLNDGETWQIVDESPRRTGRHFRPARVTRGVKGPRR